MPRRQKPPHRGRGQPSLAEPRGDVDRVQRHVVDQVVDAPQLPDFRRSCAADGGTGVRFTCCRAGYRGAQDCVSTPRCSHSPPRSAAGEQLVEVPTPVSYSSSLQRSTEQTVDIPASVRGGSGSLQGFPPEQSAAQRTALQIADIPVPGRGGFGCLLGFLPEQGTSPLHVSQDRISERIVEQIGAGGDFPSRRAGPRFVLPRQGCWCRADRRHYFFWKVLTVFSQDRFTLTCTCRLCRWISATPQAGPTAPVPVVILFLLCLLSEGRGVRGLASPHSFLGATSVIMFGVYVLPETYSWILLGLVTLPCCALPARQWILNMCQSSMTFGCYSTRFRVKVDLDVEVDSRTDQEFSYEPLVFGSHWFGVLPWEVCRKLWIYWR